MRAALVEARKGLGHTAPNPAVGAIVVRGGKLIAKGHHRRAGLPHAEIEAMRKTNHLKGATLYVTLEPCCHLKKRTPPCVGAILQSGVHRVVIGSLDPNPAVSGRGVLALRRGGILVETGILEQECRELNIFYNHWIRERIPYVILKSAASLDGKVALSNGISKWITGAAARQRVHELRSSVAAVLVGIGTVLRDDPDLTARGTRRGQQPVRIVLDPELKFPRNARMLKNIQKSPVWILCSERAAPKRKLESMHRAGAQVFLFKGKRQLSIPALLKFLGGQNVQSLLVEGGPVLWTQFLKSGEFQEWQAFFAPKVLGASALPLVEKLENQAIPENHLQIAKSEMLGADLWIRLTHKTK